MKSVVFIDRDGTIIQEPEDEQIDSLDKLQYVPKIIQGLRLLVDAGYALVMVTNQDGLGTDANPKNQFDTIQEKIITLLQGEGIVFDEIFICPHTQAEHCNCRKPKVGILGDYLSTIELNKPCSFVLGDRETDMQFARNLGVRGVRLVGGSQFSTDMPSIKQDTVATYVAEDALDACLYMSKAIRYSERLRSTKETKISIKLSLDGTGNYSIHTGINFFDHMIEQIAKHGYIDMQLVADGDVHVDEHHTVEDVGIVLGEAIRNALKNKRGIHRFGYAVPMDEAHAKVSLDLSGRSFLFFKADFKREQVGDLPTELVYDFFKAFADGLNATIHASCSGRNDHHKIEVLFKALALALRQACTIDYTKMNQVPSTKGVL